MYVKLHFHSYIYRFMLVYAMQYIPTCMMYDIMQIMYMYKVKLLGSTWYPLFLLLFTGVLLH